MEFNGIKFFNGDGYKLSDELEDEIESYVRNNNKDLPQPTGSRVGKMKFRQDAREEYINHSMKQITKYLSGLGEDYVNAYHDMLIFDCLIYNEDRHSGNFGLILDSRTLKPLEFAPLFDHGRSFFVYRNRVKCEELIDLSKNAVNYYGVPYDDIAKEYISDRQRAQLRLALDFRIPKRYYKLFSEERIKNLEEFIHYRAKELLSF